jgi:hypothetical protein
MLDPTPEGMDAKLATVRGVPPNSAEMCAGALDAFTTYAAKQSFAAFISSMSVA